MTPGGSPIQRLVWWLIGVSLAVTMLASAAPLIVQLVAAVLPLVVVIGAVAIALRLAWYYTRRY